MWTWSSVRLYPSLSTYERSKNAVLAVIVVIQAHSDRFLKDWVTQLWHPSVAPASRLIIFRMRAIIIKNAICCVLHSRCEPPVRDFRSFL
jgi:hypothetical protein